MDDRRAPVKCLDDLVAYTREVGILPFFRNGVPGFSLEEHIAPEVWFTRGVDGPWEWKGPAIRAGLVYAKLFGGRAVFITPEWYGELANVRRNGGDFDTMTDEGMISRGEARLREAFAGERTLSSRELRARAGLSKSAAESAVTRIQMDCLMLAADFDYDRDAAGRTYGWGVARYALTDVYLGEGFVDAMQEHSVETSREMLLRHLTGFYGTEHEKALRRMIG